jgi:hypothetical protein
LGTLESVSPSGHILRLVLEQTADRVSHRIEVLDADSRILAELRSIEGTSADEWPPSPALQSCSLQEIRPGERAAFLVGMAGKSHWSASMEALPNEGALVFDFACRVHQTPQWLGTSYAIPLLSLHVVTHFEQLKAGIAIHLASPADGARGADFAHRSEQSLRFACSEATSEKFPATLRWRYRIYLAEPDC